MMIETEFAVEEPAGLCKKWVEGRPALGVGVEHRRSLFVMGEEQGRIVIERAAELIVVFEGEVQLKVAEEGRWSRGGGVVIPSLLV